MIAQRYLATAEQRETTHGHLAEMFEARAPGNDDLFRRTDISAQPQGPALRRVMEQPWQLAQAGRKPELTKLISDFGFCLAKSACLGTLDLEVDFANLGGLSSINFLSSNRHVLSRSYHTIGWKNYLVFLQLALEQYPEREMHAAALRWYKKGLLPECVPYAPNLMEQTPYIVLHGSGREREHSEFSEKGFSTVHVDADASNNIQIFDAVTGQCRLFDGLNGLDLGNIESTLNVINLCSEAPRQFKIAGCRAWRLENNLWFCWGRPNGLDCKSGGAWLLYEYGGLREVSRLYKVRETKHKNLRSGLDGIWVFLPAKHLFEVVKAIPLKNGGFATLGTYANLSALLLWPPLNGEAPDVLVNYAPNPEIIMLPSGPSPKYTGITECSDGSMLVWPFNPDGICAHLAREKKERRWKVSPIRDFNSVVGAQSFAIKNGVERLIVWDCSGRVILVKKEMLDPVPYRSQLMSEPISRPPRMLWNSASPHYLSNADYKVSALYQNRAGMLVAEVDRSHGMTDIFIWRLVRRDYRLSNKNAYWNFEPDSMQPRTERLRCPPRSSDDFLKLEEGLDVDSKTNEWMSWGIVYEGHKKVFFSNSHVRPVFLRACIRNEPPQEKKPQLQELVAFLLGLIEDGRAERPFYSAHRRLELISTFSKVLVSAYPDELVAAIMEANFIINGQSEVEQLEESLLSRMVAARYQDWEVLKAWISFFSAMNPRGVRSELQRLQRRAPDIWQILLLTSRFDIDSASCLILEASRQKACPKLLVHLAGDFEGSRAWSCSSKASVLFGQMPMPETYGFLLEIRKFLLLEICFMVCGPCA